MEFKTKKLIKSFEDQIEQSYALPIFRGYIAIDKRGAEKIINELYSTLPADVQAARKFLQQNNNSPKSETTQQAQEIKKSSAYKYLKELDNKINKTIQFAKFAFINIRELEKIINKIYDNLPEEIIKAETLSKQ